jgi:hypothetical protein
MTSKYGVKDPDAVLRGKKSGEARKRKAQEISNSETTPDNTKTEFPVSKLKQKSHELILIDNETRESLTFRKKDINPEELQAREKKVLNGEDFLREVIPLKAKLSEEVFTSSLSREELNGTLLLHAAITRTSSLSFTVSISLSSLFAIFIVL